MKIRCYLTLLNIFIPGGILRGSRRERLLSKFVENECEKIDRLMELYMRWASICLFISSSIE
jgi:hypothetical protein